MGKYSDLFADLSDQPGPTGTPARKPGKYADLFADLAEGPTAAEEPSGGVLGAAMGVLGAPKAGIDWLARQGARHIYGIPVPDEATTGSMARAAAGLAPGQEEDTSIGRRLAGRALEFGVDVATDPLTAAMAGAPKFVSALGARAPQWLQVGLGAPKALQTAAGAAFTGAAGLGALQEGQQAASALQQEGLTPEAAEQLFGTALQAGGAYLGARHLARGLRAGEQAPVTPEAEAPVPEVNPLEAALARELELPTIQPEVYAPPEPPSVVRPPRPEAPTVEALQPEAPTPEPSLIQTEAPGIFDPNVTQPVPIMDPGATQPVPVLAEPRYAYRARDVGEQGVPSASHAQASLSEADVRRIAPSRTEVPQEVVRVNLDALPPDSYEVIERPGAEPWVRFRNELPEAAVERVGEVSEIDRAAADKASPELRANLAQSDPSVVAAEAGLTPEQAVKGLEDVRDDGVQELSPEAVAVKRAALQKMAAETPQRFASEPEAEAASVAAQERLRNAEIELDAPDATAQTEVLAHQEPVPAQGGQGLRAGRPASEGLGRPEGPLAPTPQPGVQPGGLGVAAEGVPREGGPSAVAAKTPTMPVKGNVKTATIFQPGETKPPQASARGAELVGEQVKLLQDAGLSDFPWLTKKASGMIFDGEGAAKSLKRRGRGKAFDIGGAVAEGAGAFKDVLAVGASLIERGVRSFPEWSAQMTQRLGRVVRDLGAHLQAIWERASDLAGRFQQWKNSRYGQSERGAVDIGPASVPEPGAPIAAPKASGKAAAVETAAPEPSVADMLIEGWKSNLVSAPGTQAANIIGNVGEQAVRVGETATAALVDRLLGGQKTRHVAEVRAEVDGAFRGAANSLGKLGQDLKDAVTLAEETETHPERQGGGAIPGKVGRAVRIPFRSLSAFDAFFKGVGGEAELRKLALRRAGGDAAKAQAIIENPPEDILAAVERSKQERTFQSPNDMAQAIINLRNKHKWLHAIAPFALTPANLAAAAWKRSPAGFWEGWKALKAYRDALGKADAETVSKLKGEAADKLARPLFGTTLMATFYMLARNGNMTGSGPTDQRAKNLLRDSGWQPYSFALDVNGKRTYIPFNRFEPVSTLLGIAADAAEAKDIKVAGDLFDKGLGSIVQNFTSKTYLQGIADAAEAVSNPKQFMSQYVSNMAGSVVPNVVAKAAQAIDPTLRETRPDEPGLAGIPQRVGRTIASRIPGLSKTLPAKRGATGDTVERPGNAVSRFLSPVQVSQDKTGKDVERMLAKLNVPVSAQSRDLRWHGRKVHLTDDEYSTLNEANTRAVEYIKQRLLSSGDFKAMPDTEEEGGQQSKEVVLRKVFERFRSRARHRVAALPGFQRRAREAR